MPDIVTYVKRIWVNHVVTYPRRYEEINQDGYIKHKPQYGQVIQQGTPFKAEYMNNMENGIADCAAAINAMDVDITEIETQIAELEEAIEDMDAAQMAAAIESLKASASACEASLSSLSGRMTTAEGNITNLQSGVSANASGISANATEINTLKGRMNTADGKITALEGRASTCESGISANATEINTLKGRMNTAEGKITSLESATSDNAAAIENKVKSFTATIPATGWTSQSSGTYYTINVSLSGILATDTPDIGIVQTGTWATDEAIRDAWASITRIVAAANQLQITADSIPSRAIPIQVRCIR